jgi:hypothetical protein
MSLIGQELPSLLTGAGVSQVMYSKKTQDMFDRLPAMGEGPEFEMAAPALTDADGRVLRRGTVWVRK